MAYVEEKQSMDAAASSQTQYSLFVGDSFKGIFSDNLDKDWVRVELVAGKTYQISLSGAGSNSGADTILTVFNSVGEQVAANDDADFAAGQLNSKLAFSPEASGVYYLSAGAYAGNPTQDHSGDYTLTLVDTEADGAGGRADDVKQEGGAGNDVLRGGAGDDVLAGGDGNDLLTGDDFPFFLLFELERGGADADGPVVCDPCAGADAVGAIMGVGHDADGPIAGYDPYVSSLTSVLAAWGDDTLSGGAGDDRLAGGPGDDRLSGGPGADVFIFAPAGGYDVVTDFRAGEDKIDLSAFAGIDSTDGLALQQQGDDLIIDLAAHGGGEITLQGFNETDLADAHFIFSAGDDPMAIA